MIKKSLFADELIAGMQQELRKQASAEQPDLVKAGECLHAALEILEDAGLQRHADKVLGVLQKIAVSQKTKPVQKMPTLQELMKHGLTAKDLQQFGQGHHGAKAKMNRALRNMGMGEAEISSFVGKHNFIPDEDLRRFEQFSGWMQDPTMPEDAPLPGDVVTMQSLPEKPEGVQDAPAGEEISFKSLAAPHKMKRPDKVPDVHTKGLTPAKMVENLKHHGTEFDMPDLGWANFESEFAEVLDANDADELNIDDIFDADVVDDTLEVSDQVPLEDFEDEVNQK